MQHYPTRNVRFGLPQSVSLAGPLLLSTLGVLICGGQLDISTFAAIHRCMQSWVVCRLLIFLESDVNDVLAAVSVCLNLTFSELLNPCSRLSLDRHTL